jgi:diguanylate cyclase (GGDEF)-like protein
MIAAVLWCAFDALESAAVGIPAHVLWAQAAYLGNMPIAALLLLFAIDYTGRPTLPNWAVGALFVVPVIGVAGAVTNEWHHFIWTGFSTVPGPMDLVVYEHGWLAWVVSIYSLVIALAAAVLLVGFALRTKAPYRRQSVALLVAVLLPWVAEILYITNSRFLPGVDPSVTIVISGAILSIGLVKFRLLELVPVAREVLVEHMEDGLLVLDANGRILDSNPAAARIVGTPLHDRTGTEVASALGGWPELAGLLSRRSSEDGQTTLVSPAGSSICVTIIPLQRAGLRNGSLITLRDATVQARTEAVLQSMNADLQLRVKQVEDLQEELREQAIRDPLTGLFNRRYLSATLQREIGRAEREGYPVSVVMIDADHFKRVNDEHGHGAGDQVLRFLGAQLRTGLRKGDIACRFGGDEFLMVLPNTAVEHAGERARQWRSAVREASVDWMEWNEPVTLSLGVAAFPDHARNAEDLVTAADAALYAAKDAGRDRVVVSDGTLRPAHAEGDVG